MSQECFVELEDEARRFVDATKANLERVKRAKRAVEKLLKEGLRSPRALRRCASALRDLDLQEVGLGDASVAFGEALEESAALLKRQGRADLMRGLSAQAEEEAVALRVLSDQPWELALSPFSVVVDIERGVATLRYSREVIEEVPAKVEEIFEARRRWGKRIKGQAMDSSAFISLLEKAYRVALIGLDRSYGERVDLVDLLPPLALLGPDQGGGFPRFLLAYQLVRMRREGVMKTPRGRLDLGTATGGSTRNKARVLFLANGLEDGQYYLSIRFSPAQP